MKSSTNVRHLAIPLAFLCALLVVRPSSAESIAPGPNDIAIIAEPGTVSTFEVDFVNPNSLPVSFDVTAYSFTLTATADPTASGLVFTSITPAPNYIFPTTTGFAGTVNSPLSVSAADSYSAGTTVGPMTSYGLATIAYSVSPDATPGIYAITFPSFSATDTSNSPITILLPGASTITIVPEPGSLALCALAGLAGLAGFVRAHRRSIPPAGNG